MGCFSGKSVATMVKKENNMTLIQQPPAGKDFVTSIPVAPLGILAMESSKELAAKVNDYLLRWHDGMDPTDPNTLTTYPGYERHTYLVDHDCPRFSNGEGKAVIKESVRGYDLYIISDVCNYGCTYKMYGMDVPMSPDDHFQDIKRVISAVGGKARRINVFLPILYEARQHKRTSRESMDCALALQELQAMGVENIITFDAHDPRVQNAIPLIGFDNVLPTYQMLKALLRNVKDLRLDRGHTMVISPDEGAIDRNIYYSSVLGIDLGLFYKRRDYTKVVNGRNPIIAHEYLGDSVEGMDIIIADDMIASGDSMLDIARELKNRKANRIFAFATFGFFTEGLDNFQKAYEEGVITKVFTTNLTYRRPELRTAPWYCEVDMSKYIAYLMASLNYDHSISRLLNPLQKIQNLLKNYREEQAALGISLV